MSAIRLLPLLLLVFSGCHKGLTWTPDSKGLVLCKSDGTVVAVDIGKDKVQKIASLEKEICWPAVTADGKEIVIPMSVVRSGKNVTVEFHFFDFSGKRLRKTKPILLADNMPNFEGDLDLDLKGLEDLDNSPAPYEPFKIRVFVSPDGKRLIATSLLSHSTVFFDLKNNTSVLIRNSEPMLIGNTPFRPDNKGCLLFKSVHMNRHKARTESIFVTWDGKSRSLGDVTRFVDQFRKLNESLYEAPFTGWDGKTAFVETSDGRWSFDTDKLKMSFKASSAKAKAKYISRQHQFKGSKAMLKVRKTPSKSESGLAELLYYATDDAEPKTILKTENLLEFYPSPDGRKVAVRFDQPSTERVIVINELGEPIWNRAFK